MMQCMVFSLDRNKSDWNGIYWNDGGSGTFTGMMPLEGGVTFRATVSLVPRALGDKARLGHCVCKTARSTPAIDCQ